MSTGQLKKIERGRLKVTSACDDRHLVCMAVNNRTASFWQLVDSSLVYRYRCINVGFVEVCCTVGCVQGFLYTGTPLGKPSMSASAMGS
ncbi:hypothetical protein TNCV_4446161 [Trichonephila clavipes]|nr:hypothetical protein TNCV_4446161 [Trichonephila clavipes]